MRKLAFVFAAVVTLVSFAVTGPIHAAPKPAPAPSGLLMESGSGTLKADETSVSPYWGSNSIDFPSTLSFDEITYTVTGYPEMRHVSFTYFFRVDPGEMAQLNLWTYVKDIGSGDPRLLIKSFSLDARFSFEDKTDYQTIEFDTYGGFTLIIGDGTVDGSSHAYANYNYTMTYMPAQ